MKDQMCSKSKTGVSVAPENDCALVPAGVEVAKNHHIRGVYSGTVWNELTLCLTLRTSDYRPLYFFLISAMETKWLSVTSEWVTHRMIFTVTKIGTVDCYWRDQKLLNVQIFIII